jgi:hypothetical protein
MLPLYITHAGSGGSIPPNLLFQYIKRSLADFMVEVRSFTDYGHFIRYDKASLRYSVFLQRAVCSDVARGPCRFKRGPREGSFFIHRRRAGSTHPICLRTPRNFDSCNPKSRSVPKLMAAQAGNPDSSTLP